MQELGQLGAKCVLSPGLTVLGVHSQKGKNQVNADKDKSDAELALSYQSGDKTAWDALCSKYGPRIAQYTLLEAMEQIHKIRKPESFRGWLFAIAKSVRSFYFEIIMPQF